MTCKELVELITEYLEGALPPPDRLRFEQHVDRCSSCHVYVEQMRQAIGGVGKLSEDSISPEAKELLLRVFEDWKRT